MDRSDVHTAGQNHADQMSSRVNMIYGHYNTGGGGASTVNNDHDGVLDLRSRYLQLQKKFQMTVQEQEGMKSKLGKVTDDRDKTQKKLDFVYKQHQQQHQQLQGYIQRLKYEKEQLEQQLRHSRTERNDRTEMDAKYKLLMEDSKRLRNDLDCAIQDRDGFKYQILELQRENEKLNNKLASISPNVNASRREMDSLVKEREEMKVVVDKLKKENETVKLEMKKISSDSMEIAEVVSKLKEENSTLHDQLLESRKTIADLENEIIHYKDKVRHFSPPSLNSTSGESLNRQSSEESLGGLRGQRSMGRIGEDFPPLRKGHSNSITELESMSGLMANKKKLSASTNNLAEDPFYRKDQIVQKLQTQLNRVFKEKEKLSQKLSSMREARGEMEVKIKVLEEERDRLKEELGQTKMASGTAKSEMEVLKGVALQQTTQSYEKNMQLQTQVLEMQTEKSLIEKQRDIAMKERERMVTEAISLKKKLETIKAQRQKDAKELANMRKLKDKTEKESVEMSRKYGAGTESLKKKEAQYIELVDSLRPLFPSSSDINEAKDITNTQVSRLVSQLQQEHANFSAIVRLIYGSDAVLSEVSSSTLMTKLEGLFHEKSEMVVEIEELQRSASKLNEERIFDLKQTIETLYMEQEVLSGKNHSLMSRIGKLEVERDKLRKECERLDKQCQELNSTLSSPTQIGNILKSSAHQHWEETWEMKNVKVPLGSEGKAGFSVVGGRDQPQLPNPGSFIVTNVNKGGPAEGKLRVGDVLESVNGIDLQNADHSVAVHAVKESKGLLNIALRRRKKAHALQVGVAGAVMTLGEEKKTEKEKNEYSLLLQKEGIGFTWDWEAHYTVTGIAEGGPAYLILKEGDRLVQINGQCVAKEKPSAVKKLLKPHKGILRVVVEREVEQSNVYYLTSQAPPPSVQESLVPSSSRTNSDHGSGSSLSKLKVGGSSWGSEETSQTSSFDHSGSHNIRPTSYMSSQDSGASQEPVKMVDKDRVKNKDRFRKFSSEGPQSRPTSDGFIYGGYDKKEGYEEASYGSEIGCTGYSESISESFLSEPLFHDTDSSQTSIELTFHPFSQVSHNHLTVQSTLSTLPDKESNSEDDSYFARDDGTRTTFRTRSGSDGNMPSYADYELHKKGKKQSGRKNKLHSVRKGFRSGSMSQLSEPEYEQYADPSSKKRSRSKSLLAVRGKSRSNLSLTPARSMTSVIEEPRRSISITSVSSEHDPLADATYIRANFSYVPRHPQEIPIKYGDTFHIIEEAPSARHRRSFWVSKLNKDGTDSDVGAIPNSSRAQEWLDEQGEASDIFVYEEVEPFTGVRPVIICGVLANRIADSLAESYPNMFHQCKSEFLEGTARITEARLNRERSEGKIVDYQRVNDGYKVIPKISLSSREIKGKCVLVSGSLMAVQTMKKFAPSIAILIKAGAEDSLRAFGYDHLSPEEIQQMYGEARMMDEQHGHEFTACLTLVFEETLLKQITDIVKHEKHNQTWVPVKRIHTS